MYKLRKHKQKTKRKKNDENIIYNNKLSLNRKTDYYQLFYYNSIFFIRDLCYF